MKLFTNPSGWYERASNLITNAIRALEILISCLLIFCVLVSSIFMIYNFFQDFEAFYKLTNYDNMQQLLSYILLLIIGLELSIMLIRHNPANVIEVMIYAIARKMLIYNTSSVDMLFGVLTLFLLFLIKIYIIQHKTFSFRKNSAENKESHPIQEKNLSDQ